MTRSTSGDFDTLMPGDRVTLTYVVTADVSVVYAFRASLTGAELLREQLRAVMTTEDGEILYVGLLADAGFKGRALPAELADRIVVGVYLPLDATVSGDATHVRPTSEFTASRA